MKDEVKLTIIKDGFVEPVLRPEDYISGSDRSIDVVLGQAEEVIRPDGQWDAFLPQDEIQVKDFDTFGCTIFTTTNQIEIYQRGKTGEAHNYADRAGYIMADIKPPGTDPQNVYEMARRQGLLNEEELPWTDDIKTLEQYASPKPLPPKLLEKAEDWLVKYLFKHEYLPKGDDGYVTPETIKEKLKYSPVAVAVFAWAEKDGKYIRLGEDTHWTLITGTYENGDWKCFDTYPPFRKRLDKDFKFRWAKRIYISTPGIKREERTLLSLISKLIGLFTARFLELKKETPAPKPEEKPITMPDEVIPPPAKEPETSKLVKALIQVESNGNDYAKGDKGLAYGCLQIHQGTLLDVNAFSSTNYKLQDLLGNRKLSVWVFEQYMKLYAREKRLGRPVTDEDKARIWNGGPNGYKKQSTVKYWEKVKVALSQLT